MHAMALPLLFVLAAGKLATVLGGDGQGAPTDAWWATAYAGPGPWGSLGPEIPSHPSQVYEAIATTAVLAVLGLALRVGIFGRRDGSALLAGVALWALGRGVVAFTWRDATVAGPLVAEHVVLVAVIGVCVGGLVRLRLGGPHEASLLVS
jgi:prolipoprotein diacylglyceryltransferase